MRYLRTSVGMCAFTLFSFTFFLSFPSQASDNEKKILRNAIEEDSAAFSTSGGLEACFSPDERCDVKLIQFVDSARSSLDVAIFDINLEKLVNHLLAKSKSINVRVVVDKRQSKGNKSLADTLINGGVNVRYGHQKGIMHNKFIIVDGNKLETGSFNFTNHASQANNENQLYVFNDPIIEKYSNRFQEIWDEAKEAK